MTRWKREYRKWAERERLDCWITPKRWEDYRVAQTASRFYDHVWKKPETQKRFHDEVANLLLYGNSLGPDAGLASLLPD